MQDDLRTGLGERQHLPPAIAQQLEQPVSGRGNLDVLGILPEADSENKSAGILRTAHLGGKDYRAFVYGRRLSQATVQDIPLHGIAIGDALDDGRLKKGKLVVFAAVGAGYTVGAVLARWAY